MKNLLIDRARSRRAAVHGGALQRVEWDEARAASDEDADLVLAVADAMKDLALRSPQLATLVDLRYFAGFTEEEVAQIMGVCSRTVRRQWREAREWLLQSMKPGGFGGSRK
jgi:RNA polymerase sigma factor (TIGR02999 family)